MQRVRETIEWADPDTGRSTNRASWASILLGALIAMGVLLLLTLLGIALGFSAVDPRHDANPLSGIQTSTAIYVIIAHMLALFIGGYAAAKLAKSTWSSAAILHGAAVWALAALLTTAVALAGIGTLISGTASLVSTVAGGATQATQALVPNNVNLPNFRNLDTLIPDNFMSALPSEIQQSLEQKDLTVNDIQQEAGEAIRQVISQQEQERARQAVTSTATAIISNPSQASQEIQQLYNQLFGDNGLISQQDQQEVMQILQNRLGITPAEAEAVMNELQARMDEVAEDVQAALNELQKQATQIAEQVTNAIASAAWWLFIISILGLAAAIGGAMLGRTKAD